MERIGTRHNGTKIRRRKQSKKIIRIRKRAYKNMGWKERFIEIYGSGAAREWLPELAKRMQAAGETLQNKTGGTKDQNVILITYPDQFYGEENNLTLFERFAQMYLEGVFDVVHFLPFCPYSSDDGFSVIDYKSLADGLGEWENLERLSGQFILMYDFVCNHVSAESKWFLKCLAGDKAYENFFIEADPKADWSMVIRPRTTPLLTGFSAADGEKYYWTTFSEDQIDLNYHNPAVFWEAADIFLTYLERGGTWIRLDAIGFLWKEAGTSCMHHENTHRIVKLFRAMMEEVCPEGRIVTETNVPHEDNVSYFGNGYDESHMVYQFPLPMLVLYSFYKKEASVLSNWASGLSLPSDKTCFFNFLASHDGIGINPVRSIVPEEEIDRLVVHLQEKSDALVSYKENADGSRSAYEVNVSYFSALQEDYDFETAKCRYLNAHGVLLGMQGDAAVYINSYLGVENDREGVSRTGRNRSINRKKFAYGQLMKELEETQSRTAQIRKEMERLIRVRKSCDAFDTHARQTVLREQKELFGYIRSGKTKTVLCLHNFSDKTIERAGVSGRDLLSGEEIEESVKIAPFDFKWIAL